MLIRYKISDDFISYKFSEDKMKVPGLVDFSRKLRTWDGFGVNYVETCQTYDNVRTPQDYGGFSTLSDEKKAEILDMTFGENGLKPGIIKMFLDPLHQNREPSDLASDESAKVDLSLYDHESTTANMREFITEGLRITRERGSDLSIYTALYGPPKWMTKHKVWRGRDLDEKYWYEAARYIVSWVKYLSDNGYPIKFVGVHNEGEDFYRWDDDGYTKEAEKGHDYNLWWSPEAVSRMMPVLRKMLIANDLENVYPTPGETSNWGRFSDWGYSDALTNNHLAMNAIGLITSHGFYNGNIATRWYGDHRSQGIDDIRESRPELNAWTTSTSWSHMDAAFLQELRGQIYSTKVNGIIPWALIQNHSLWADGDPNPGCAFLIDGKGGYEVQPGYWYYRQLSRIGQPSSKVVVANLASSECGIVAFSAEQSESFCIINAKNEEITVSIRVKGITAWNPREIFRTSKYENSVMISDPGIARNSDDSFVLTYTAPAESATTFILEK